MRVLFVSQEYGDDEGTGGIGSYVTIIAPALRLLGHDVHVLICREGLTPRDEDRDGVILHRRPALRIRGLRHVVRGPETRHRVVAAVSAWFHARRLGVEFDVVEAPEWMAEGFVLALTRHDVVIHLHTPARVIESYSGVSLNTDRRWADRLERWSSLMAARRTAPSLVLVDELRRTGWLGSSEAVDVVPHPIDPLPWRNVPPATTTGPIVLAVGRVEARKAPEIIAGAVDELRSSNPTTVAAFAGRPSGTRDGMDYAAWLAHRYPEAVVLLGEIPRRQLADVLASARVVVVASLFESFSIAAIEAMAAGRAVIATDRVGAGPIIQEGGGAIVRAGSTDALRDALRPFLDSAEFAAAAGMRSRDTVLSKCAPDAVARERARIFEVVARAASVPSRRRLFTLVRRLVSARLHGT